MEGNFEDQQVDGFEEVESEQFETEEQLDGDEIEASEDDVVEDFDSDVEEGEEEEDSEEPFRVIIPIRQLDGKTVEEEIDEEQLVDLATKGKHFDELYRQAVVLQNQAVQSKELVEFVARDPISSRIVTMRIQGYSDHDILNHLQEIVAMNTQPEQQIDDPYFDSLDDTQRQAYKRMQDRLEQEAAQRQEMDKQLKAMQIERYTEATINHNQKVFDEALERNGYDYKGSEQENKRVHEAMQALFPGVDPRRVRFSKDQVDAIFSRAGLGKRTNKAATQIKQATKASSAPRVVGGSKSAGNNRRAAQPHPISSPDERQRKLMNFGI